MNPILNDFYTAFVLCPPQQNEDPETTLQTLITANRYLIAILTAKETSSYKELLSHHGKHNLEVAASVLKDIQTALEEKVSPDHVFIPDSITLERKEGNENV